MHELGHALGLSYWDTTINVMRLSIGNANNTCTLGNHDISDYEVLWGVND